LKVHYYNVELQDEYQPDLFHKARLLSVGGTKRSGVVVCSALVYRKGFTARANTVWSYSEINRALCRINPQPIPPTSVVDPKTQIGMDSLIGDGVSILERCSVKRSIIGNHVKIGKNCKITNSIVMDYVVVEDGYVLLI
jgi:translation initiation factor eIF-2B subunit gamma